MNASDLSIPHIPVLLNHLLFVFENIKDGTVVDCTVGYGGHSEAMLSVHEGCSLVGFDRDEEAIAFASKRLERFGDRVTLQRGDFAQCFEKLNVDGVSAVLADIGVSSLQLDKPQRGFGFDSPVLDMRMDDSQQFSANDVVNGYSERQLCELFFKYGEEPKAKKYAKKIVEAREKSKIQSASQLAQIISNGEFRGRIHPATLVFQAIRIEVNDELGQLERFLESSRRLKGSGAVLAVISFHSLEDRIVKQAFKEFTKSCICPPQAMRCVCGGHHELGKLLTKKPLEADEEECRANPRARSAKLRAFQFIDSQKEK